MQVGRWLLWATWLYTWVEGSRRCQCQCTCIPELVKEHDRHRLEHRQHRPHRDRPHRRKGSRLRADVGEVPPRIVHHPSDVVVKVGNPATLSCRADGTPEPSIEWLRNGQPMEMDKLDSQSRPIVLSEGSLFFLSVVPGRRSQSHEGVYACMARNSAGKATSRNASLYIAALREDFRVQPSDVEVAVGEVAVMNCSPPVGHPEPNVTWRKDGVPINNTDPHYTELNGKLIIAPAQKNNSGVYICVASNTVGVRESRAARLSVLAKPVLVLKPQDVSVGMGESAQFFCEAKGDPMPAVEWSREQGPLPNGRYLVNPDQSIKIHYVTPQDSGRYTCTAVNDVGVVTASAQLLVEEAANIRQRDLHRELSALRIALENVTVLTPNSNMSQVQWKLQSFPTQPQYLDGFEVLYRSLLPASSEWAAKRMPIPNFQTLVGPLKRGYKYEFKVRPYGSSLYGRESNTRHLRVPETVPSAPPQAVSITMAPDHNDTIHVTWEPPPHEAHNGIIQGYQLCVQSEEKQYLNWTVDSGTHSLEINPLYPGKQYWVRVAAVNGAGVGVQSDPHRLVIDSLRSGAPQSDGPSRDLTQVLAVLRDPVFIGSFGALLWCVLIMTAVCLYRRHTRPSDHLGRGHSKAKGLYRLASEDLIIKHRMAAPDSPCISGAWRPAQSGELYQGMWAQSQENPGFRKTTLSITAKKDPGSLDSAVPIVPDSCGVYRTFFVDLTGNALKTLNSPTRCPKRPHCHASSSSHSSQHGAEMVCISQPVIAVKTTLVKDGQALPPAQPKMGMLKESWEKNYKRELPAVNSASLESSRSQALTVRGVPYKQRLSHLPPGGRSECVKPLASPRILHYSASLHLVDMLPTPPPLPMDDTTDTHSLTSEEGSSRSTKLTVDAGSLQSVCAASGLRGASSNTTGCPSYSRLSTASYLSMDEEQDVTMTSQEVTQYLELSPKAERRSTMLENPPSSSLSRPFSPTPTLGYICGPLPTDQLEDRMTDDQESQPMGSRRAQPQSTPLSLCSEWEGSLWNGWGSVSEGNMANSARTSFVSSSDGSFMNDANDARVLATEAAESMSGASFSDVSPPASPLSALFPPARGEGGECFGELDPMPVWDWSTAWVEEMEAQYRAQYPSQADAPHACDTWGRCCDDRHCEDRRPTRGDRVSGRGGSRTTSQR